MQARDTPKVSLEERLDVGKVWELGGEVRMKGVESALKHT
jgi:hypothetical protein